MSICSMVKRVLVAGFVSGMCLLAAARPAMAQGPSPASINEAPIGSQTASVGGNVEGLSQLTGWGGWGDYARKVQHLSGDGDIVGEFSFTHFDGGTVVTVMGGYRAAESVTPQLKLYGQMLAGLLHDAGTSDFALQPGAGADFSINPRLALRIRLDFPIDFFTGGHQTGLRVGVGIAIPISHQ